MIAFRSQLYLTTLFYDGKPWLDFKRISRQKKIVFINTQVFAGTYMENSYTNSNNGGSVNSQDSMWQMKMAAANGAPVIPPHQMLDRERQSNYEYDPMTHGGYGTVEDYAPYQRLPHAQPAPADYMRASQNPSRQDYCSDPYASVHKPKKRIDQHMGESTFQNFRRVATF